VVRVMDLATNEGDARFHQIRSRLFTRFNEVLSQRVSQERTVGDDVDPRATAGAMTSMLAHVADHRYGFESYGIRTADVRTAMGRILYSTVTGRPAPNAVTGRTPPAGAG
jgi:Tetracyclin repressor-like, C-terminal domain